MFARSSSAGRNHINKSRQRLRTIRHIEALETRYLLTGDVYVAEFMASNRAGIRDEFGTTSDWIELFNTSQEAVDLGGWYLTDDADDLTMWQFPDVTIGPKEFLIVFASGNDRQDPDSALHTNFKLKAAGEYLGLVEADGTTIAHEYGTLEGGIFPQQLTDVSYGFEQTTLNYSFVDEGAEVGVLIPVAASQDLPAATWTAVEYDDASWPTHNLGIGFDANEELLGALSENGNIAGVMRGNTASAYARAEFQIDGPVPEMDALTLNINYDDGFVAYLNGVEVVSGNAPPAERDWNAHATQSHVGTLTSVEFDGFSNANQRNLFTRNGNSTFVGDRLQITDGGNHTGATWLTEPLAFGADYSFSTTFALDVHSPFGIGFLEPPDADGIGGQGMTFVLQSSGPFKIGGGGGDLGLENADMTFVAVEFDTFASGTNQAFDDYDAAPTHIGIDTSAGGSLARVGVPRFNGGSQGDNPRFVWVDYEGATDTMDVYFSAVDTKPDAPTLSTTVDLESLFGGVTSLWAGFTATTSFNWNAHEVSQWEITTLSKELGLTTEIVDLSDHIGLLQSGPNVLAIHGLNVNADDDDFLVSAALDGAQNNVTFLDSLGYFSDPTPGKTNGAGGAGPTSQVEFSISGRTFTDSLTIELMADPAAVIRYTTDGSIPSEESPLYSGPISVDASTRIRARAFEAGRIPSPVVSHGYIEVDSSLTTGFDGGVFNSNLPLMIFDSFGDSGVNTDNLQLVPVSTVLIDVNGDGRSTILSEPDFAGRAGMRIRGQESEGWPKKQYALEFWEESVSDTRRLEASATDDRVVSVFGLPEESDWILNGPYSDKTQMRNYLSFLWTNRLGQYASRAKFVEVFVNANGDSLKLDEDYRGTYVLLEKIKADANRVAITPLTPADDSNDAITGGYIWKKDKDGRGDVNFNTDIAGQLKFVEPQQPSDIQFEWLSNHLQEFESVLDGPDFADPEIGYAKYIDVDSFVDQWLMLEAIKDTFAFRLDTFWSLDQGGKITTGPTWDNHISLGNANWLEGGLTDGWIHDLIGGDQYPYFPRLFDDPAFEDRVADRWLEMRRTVLSTEQVLSDIDEAVGLLTDGTFDPAQGAIARNFDRWGTVDEYVWPNCFFPGNSPPQQCRESPLPANMSPNGAPNSYDDYIFLLKDFVTNRFAWIDEQFARPEFSPDTVNIAAGTQVEITSNLPGTIYYTTDGSDPRDPVEVETFVIVSGGDAQILVPDSDDLISACTSNGIFLANPDSCFMNPAYAVGTSGESWVDGTLPIGFENGAAGFGDVVNTDVAAEMNNVNSSAYVRIPFEITAKQKQDLKDLTLSVNYDDGFVAYLWLDELDIPVEIARRNAPGASSRFPIDSLPFDAAATEDRESSAALVQETVDLAANGFVSVGTNYLILQGLNATASSPEFLLDAELTVTTSEILLPPTVTEYTGPITVDQSTVIHARVFDEAAETWSTANIQTYVVSGDVDFNHSSDIDDLDSLCGAIGTSSHDARFDINNDGTVGRDDLGSWLSVNSSADRQLVRGDTNLDFHVDATDLNSLGLSWQQSSDYHWSAGDFDCDGTVLAADLNQLGSNWQHGVSMAAAAPARMPRAPLAVIHLIPAVPAVIGPMEESLATGGQPASLPTPVALPDLDLNLQLEWDDRTSRAGDHAFDLAIARSQRYRTDRVRTDDILVELTDEVLAEWPT